MSKKHEEEKANRKRKQQEEEQANRKSKQQDKEKENKESGLPSMPKGETVGNIFIDGKGGSTQVKEAAVKQRKAKEAQ